jgi:hypothetical protein
MGARRADETPVAASRSEIEMTFIVAVAGLVVTVHRWRGIAGGVGFASADRPGKTCWSTAAMWVDAGYKRHPKRKL